MKTALLLSLMTVSFISQANAKAFFGKVEHYITTKNEVVEIGTNEISDDGQTATYFNRVAGKRVTTNMSELSKSTDQSIAGVKAGEHILVTTQTGSGDGVITRFCAVWNLFENKQAFVGCRTYEADRIPGYAVPQRLTFIINNVENVIAEVQSLDGYKKGDTATLDINTQSMKAGKTVRVVAIFSNGQALVEGSLAFINTSGLILKPGVERVNLSNLTK